MDAPQQELKERREAFHFANSEFNGVKRVKLDRERANRASAAASRAKIVCYARELEKRTDRFELDRNLHSQRADRAIRKLNLLRYETRNHQR